MVSISKQLLDLVLFPPNSGGFVPVYFSQMDRAIRQPHAGDSFALPPAATPIGFSQAGDFANSRPRGEGLDVGYFVLNLEVHQLIVSPSPDTVNGRGGRRHPKMAQFPCFSRKYRYIPRHLTRKHGSKGRPVAAGP